MRLLRRDFGGGDADPMLPQLPATQPGFVVAKAVAPSAVPSCLLSAQLCSGLEQAGVGRPSRFAAEQAPGGLSTTQAWTGGKCLLSSLKRAFFRAIVQHWRESVSGCEDVRCQPLSKRAFSGLAVLGRVRKENHVPEKTFPLLASY